MKFYISKEDFAEDFPELPASVPLATMENFYTEYPYFKEALNLLRPTGDGPEYQAKRRAYDALLFEITRSYMLWSMDKAIIVEIRGRKKDER